MTLSDSEPRGERRAAWLLLVAALIAALWLVRRAKPHVVPAESRFDLSSVLPAGPELLISVDLERLDAASGRELLQAGGDAFLGLREQCGFEPLLGLRRVVFAVPFSQQRAQVANDFALIAETSLEQEAVLRCAEAVIRQRGGQPARSNLGHFTSVRDQEKPLGEVAIRADGLFVLSGGRYFRDVIDSADGIASGDDAARLRTQVHAALRRRLSDNQLVLTLVPGATVPLPGIQALGLGLRVDKELELRGFVGCTSTADCAQAHQLAERAKTELAAQPALSGLASLEVAQREAQLDVKAHFPRQQLAALLTQLLAP